MSNGRSMEACRRNADDGHRLSIENERPIQNPKICAEMVLPVVITEDDRVRFINDCIVGGIEQSSQCRPQSQEREITARHRKPVDTLYSAIVRDVTVEIEMRRDTGENSLRALEILEHRIAEHRCGIIAH